jgi:O-antigen ligase
MTIIYIVSLVLLLQQTFLNTTSYIWGSMLGLFGVPSGYRAYAAAILLLPFLLIIVFNSPRKARNALLAIGLFWLPWLIYLAVRGWDTPEGLWKFQTHLVATFLPTMFIGLIAASRPQLFEKYFIPCLMALCIFAITIILSGLFGDYFKTLAHAQFFKRDIVLSRALGLILVYMLVTSAWERHPIAAIPTMIAIFGTMIVIGSRGPVISVLMVAAFYAIIKNRKSFVKLTAICIAVTMLIGVFTYSDELKESVSSFATHGKEHQKSQYFGQDRLVAYMPTLQIFSDHPLFGAGLGQWWKIYRPHFIVDPYSAVHYEAERNRMKGLLDYAYPHNMLLELLAELGLVGLALFALLFLPYKRLFDVSNKYNLLCLLGLFYATSSNDLAMGNAAVFVFNTLSILYSRNLLPQHLTNKAQHKAEYLQAETSPIS